MTRIYCLLLCALLLCSFRFPTTETAITGHLRSKTHHNVSGVTVFVKGCIDNGMGIATTDKNGDFILGFDDGERTKPLSFYYINNHNDTILLKRVYKLKSDTPEMTFLIK